MSCSFEGEPIAVISKFLPIKFDGILKFVGFGRLLKGKLKKGDKVNMWNVKNEKFTLDIEQLFYWMGSKPVPIDEVYPGNIFGICDKNLGSYKTAYISEKEFPDILPILNEKSMVRVRISCENLQELPWLVESLKILNKVDPVCEIYNDEKGNYILTINGEIHLERCIKDLQDDYFGKKVLVSDFLVDFKETAINQDYQLVKKNKNK